MGQHGKIMKNRYMIILCTAAQLCVYLTTPGERALSSLLFFLQSDDLSLSVQRHTDFGRQLTQGVTQDSVPELAG